MMNRESSRRSDFKKGIDATEGRRRRTETTITLRKTKKDEGLAKRRAMPVAPTDAATNGGNVAMDRGGVHGVGVEAKAAYTAADIPSLARALLADPTTLGDDALLEIVTAFRKILSVERDPPVDEILASGVLPAFVRMLQCHDKPGVQFEAAWALTNIASTDETRAVVDAGAVPHFAGLLSSPDARVREQAAWCLGNVAGDSPALRDVVLNSGAMGPLLQNIQQPASESLLGNCVWSLSNFCRGKPVADLGAIAPAVPVLAQILRGAHAAEARSDALWALSYASDGDDDRIQAVVDAGIADVLVGTLDEEPNLTTPALRTVGNIVSGTDHQTQAVLDAGLLPRMHRLLHHPKRALRKEACWVLSNVAAGTQAQINAVLKTKGCVSRVVELALSGEWEVRREAVWVVSNVVTGGRDGQVMSAIEAGAIDVACGVLESKDAKMVTVALEALEAILQLGAKLGKDYLSFVDECDGITMIERLQEHESDDVYRKAVSLIETYFGEEDEEDENLAPDASGGTFSFGVPPQKVVGGEDECPAGGNGGNGAQPFAAFNFASV